MKNLENCKLILFGHKNFFLLLLLLFTMKEQVLARGETKIISYNILEGMKNDTSAGKQNFVDWLKDQAPDILALEECNDFTQVSLEELAHTYGHPYAVIVKEKGYPVGITSKYPIVKVQKVTDNMAHGFIVAEIKGFNIIVLHLSPHNYLKRREEINEILTTVAATHSQKKWIMMGDFNSLSPLDMDNYADGKVLKQIQLAAVKYTFHKNLVEGKYLDFDVHKKILDFGFKDAGKTLETAEGPKGKRIDYIYVSKDLISRDTKAHFIKDNFTAKYSDHKPVLMVIKQKN